MDYKQKYLKYKQKYLQLKNQSGGMGSTASYYWNQHPDFRTINDSNLINVILHPRNTTTNRQYDRYSRLLDNLLRIENGLIDIKFITDFARHIYYDINGTNFGLTNNTWNNPAINKYDIKHVIKQPHGNTTIIFLEEKETKQKKVLKIFNSINIDISKIKDYLSLEVTHITDNTSFAYQKNYNPVSKAYFNVINFNVENIERDFVRTNNPDDRLYLSCKNNDAINDYIINLILQKIKETNDFNFVRYDNFFVTQVNGQYRYCIIMEQLDGSLDTYLEKDIAINNYDELHRILSKIESDLNILKQKKYLFTHTDMKCENVFYKKEDDIIQPYLADFDKSSITFHNIRFYNDITQTSFFKGLVSNPMSSISEVLRDWYTILNVENRGKEPFYYRFSRVARHIMFGIGLEMLETEQIYMRYYYTPYYTSFDMCSLLLSVFNMKNVDVPILNTIPREDIPLKRLITKYIRDSSLKDILRIYNTAKLPKGNFGSLVAELLNQPTLDNCFIHTFDRSENPPHINKLYLSLSSARKICLSIPFVPISVQKQVPNITVFNCNQSSTIDLYDTKKIVIPANILGMLGNIPIEYNIDYKVGDRAMFSVRLPKIIFITNRYSYTQYGFNGVYDYDNVDEKDIVAIYNFMLEIRNN